MIKITLKQTHRIMFLLCQRYAICEPDSLRFVGIGQRIIGWPRPFCRSSFQVPRRQEHYPSHVCDSDSFSPSRKSDVEERRNDNNLRTIVMFRTVHDLRYHHTRNIEKGARGVGKLRAVERRSRSGEEMSARVRECAAARCLTSN